MHPQLAEWYRRRIDRLERLLEGSEQDEAREVVRSMIDRVVLTPRPDGRALDATLSGALATLLSVSGRGVGQQKTLRGGAVGESTVGGCGGTI